MRSPLGESGFCSGVIYRTHHDQWIVWPFMCGWNGVDILTLSRYIVFVCSMITGAHHNNYVIRQQIGYVISFLFSGR